MTQYRGRHRAGDPVTVQRTRPAPNLQKIGVSLNVALPASMKGRLLTAADSEPPIGSVVLDALGRQWLRMDADGYGGPGRANWLCADGADPESWVKVAGNYGPVEVVRYG